LNNAVGTAQFISPETAQHNGQVSFPADVWSVGVTMYLMLCGKYPFAAAADAQGALQRVAFRSYTTQESTLL
jgi:serine/threonine protein kinase